MIAATIARRLTTGTRRALLAQPWPATTGPAQVVIATPRRFVSLRKLIRPNDAIDGMLDVIQTTRRICADTDTPLRFAISDRPLPHAPRLYLSHHTVATDFTARLTAAGSIVRHFKAADLPGRSTFDPLGFSGWSSLAGQTLDTLPLDQIDANSAALTFDAARAATALNQSKYAQSAAAPIPGDYVFVALQTIGDMVQRKAYVPMLDMLDMVIARFAGTGTQVVIKRHPKCRSKRVAAALSRASQTPGVTVTDGSIHGLLARAQALFTVNSGVGSEAIVHRTPIYCFGASDYAAVAHHIRSKDDLDRLTRPLHHRANPAALCLFHHYYRQIYQVDRATGLAPYLTALIAQSMADSAG